MLYCVISHANIFLVYLFSVSHATFSPRLPRIPYLRSLRVAPSDYLHISDHEVLHAVLTFDVEVGAVVLTLRMNH
jgi:hypothetical protein